MRTKRQRYNLLASARTIPKLIPPEVILSPCTRNSETLKLLRSRTTGYTLPVVLNCRVEPENTPKQEPLSHARAISPPSFFCLSPPSCFSPSPSPFAPFLDASEGTNDASFTRAIPRTPRVPGSLFQVEALTGLRHQLHLPAQG